MVWMPVAHPPADVLPSASNAWSMDPGRWVDAVVTSVTHGGYPNAVYSVKWGAGGGGEDGVGVDRLARKRGYDYSPAARAARAAKAAAAREAAGLKYAPGSFLARLHGETEDAAAAALSAPIPTMAPPSTSDLAAMVARWLAARDGGEAGAERSAWLEAAVAIAAGLPDSRSTSVAVASSGATATATGSIHARAPCHAHLRAIKAAATRAGAGGSTDGSAKGCANGDGCRWKHVDRSRWMEAWSAAVVVGEGERSAQALARAMAQAAEQGAKQAAAAATAPTAAPAGGGGWRARLAAAKGLCQ